MDDVVVLAGVDVLRVEVSGSVVDDVVELVSDVVDDVLMRSR